MPHAKYRFIPFDYASIRRTDKNGQLGVAVTQKTVDATKKSTECGHPYLTKRLVSLMLEYRMPEAKDFIPAAEILAERFEAELNFNVAHDAWLLVGRLQHSSGNPEGLTASAIKAAETYVRLADLEGSGSNPSYMTICAWLERAVASFRSIKGGKVRAEELYQRLTALQPRIKEEMQHHSLEIDIKEPVEMAIKHVSDRTAIGALLAVAFYRRPPSQAELSRVGWEAMT